MENVLPQRRVEQKASGLTSHVKANNARKPYRCPYIVELRDVGVNSTLYTLYVTTGSGTRPADDWPRERLTHKCNVILVSDIF